MYSFSGQLGLGLGLGLGITNRQGLDSVTSHIHSSLFSIIHHFNIPINKYVL